MTDVAVEYIELGLRLGRPGRPRDSDDGPAEIERADRRGVAARPGLARGGRARLRESGTASKTIAASGCERSSVGLETARRKLAGAEIAFADEVALYYGVPPPAHAESVFGAGARGVLDAVLPGERDRSRSVTWPGANGDRMPARPGGGGDRSISRTSSRERYERARLAARGRSRRLRLRHRTSLGRRTTTTAAASGAASDQHSTSRWSRTSSSSWSAHEIYPGHHTEHAWKEQLLVREAGSSRRQYC